MDIRQAILDLKSMGYRKLSEHIWAKPIGYMLFSVDLDKKHFESFFPNFTTGETMCMERKPFDGYTDKNFLFGIKEFEQWTHKVYTCPKDYHWNDPTDYLDL